jgi:hypothetical protein
MRRRRRRRSDGNKLTTKRGHCSWPHHDTCLGSNRLGVAVYCGNKNSFKKRTKWNP